MLEISNLSLDIPVGSSKRYGRSLNFFNNKVGGILKNKHNITYIRALNKINLTIKKGERIALIGHNGSGKSTLLRVISNIFKPSEGEIKGQFFTPLLNRSFMVNEDHPGIDAIKAHYLYSRRKVRTQDYKNFEKKVIEDSGLGKFINVPIRTYSTGMAERLQFCLATSFKDNALAIDEGFGTADSAFTSFAIKKLNKFMDSTETIVFASHSEALLTSFCQRGIILKGGVINFDGPIKEAFDLYHKEKTPENLSI